MKNCKQVIMLTKTAKILKFLKTNKTTKSTIAIFNILFDLLVSLPT